MSTVGCQTIIPHDTAKFASYNCLHRHCLWGEYLRFLKVGHKIVSDPKFVSLFLKL